MTEFADYLLDIISLWPFWMGCLLLLLAWAIRTR